jgi:hypothetical protein
MASARSAFGAAPAGGPGRVKHRAAETTGRRAGAGRRRRR